ncbi:N-acetyltransferase family protein [Alkalihalobacillus sp. 1P02AB]|uniref:GNAT family N-acetyltransferase n=1 Tax=Alkalihalobacillus sp. 1P02AB TaxID=3132260 RepID=UPI0039A702B7
MITLHVRQAVLEDAKGIAKVHVDSWRSTYAGIIPDVFLDTLSYEQRERRWEQIMLSEMVYVAENNVGTIVGFANGGRERSGKYHGYTGELYSMYVLEEFQKFGLGRELIRHVCHSLKVQEMYSMITLVLAENDSRHFYKKLGAEEIDCVQIEIAGKKLDEIVYGWEDIKIFEQVE